MFTNKQGTSIFINLCFLTKLQVAVIVNSSRYLGHTYFEIYVQSLEEKSRACSINQSAALPSSCLNMHIAYNEMKAWFCDKLIKKVVDGCIVLPGFFNPTITIHFYFNHKSNVLGKNKS